MASRAAKKQRIPNAERREKSMAAVLDAALKLFVTRGFEATSMDEVANQAGLTKGAVYFYFRDKLSLLHALLERTEAQLFDPIYERMDASPGTATERMTMLINWLARVGADQPELPLLHVLVSLQMLKRGNAVEARVAETYERLHTKVAELIKDGQRTGEFAKSVAPREQSALFVALIDGLLLQWHRWGGDLDGRALADTARRFIVGGLQHG